MDHGPLEVLLVMSPFLAFAAAVVYLGKLAYDARVARETAPPPYDREAPIHELARIHAQMADEARAARDTLAKTRDTLRRGIKG